jgi:hypothetical protein
MDSYDGTKYLETTIPEGLITSDIRIVRKYSNTAPFSTRDHVV